MASFYQVPADFWDHPLGQMVARAMLWLEGDELITIAEAAELAGISSQAISQRIDSGSLRGFTDPDAPQKQGRRLVRRSDVMTE